MMFAVIYIPSFSLQAVLRHELADVKKPVALVDPHHTKTQIVQLNRAALKQGVVTGLTASQAMARCPELQIKARSVVQEEAATTVLLQVAYAFSARIEATGLGVCTMSLQGLKLECSVEEWAENIRKTLASLQLVAQIGVAEAPELALLATRSSRAVTVIRDASDFTSSLPIEALKPEPRVLDILHRWGIHTVGAFISLGKDKVLERLGEETLVMFERVSPGAVRPLRLIFPDETFVEEIEFEAEVETIEPLLFVLRRFIEQLSRRLSLIYLVVAEMRLRLDLASGAKHEQVLKIPSPTGNVETLFRMVHTHLESLRTDAPVIRLKLEAIPTKPDLHQFGLFETTLRNPNQFAETLARLTALCGAENVGTPVPEATHRPDAFIVRVPDFKQESKPPKRCRSGGLQLRRFRPAVTAVMQFRDHLPAVIHSPAIRGAVRNVRGPFLNSGNWWDDRRWAREEWDVAIGEGLYRVFRSTDGCFIEGVYD